MAAIVSIVIAPAIFAMLQLAAGLKREFLSRRQQIRRATQVKLFGSITPG
jgi:hypothetical protein